jgi:opacity protein-like surface antigen
MGGLGYEMSDHFSAVAGYRALGVDYQDGDFEFDVTIQGPIVGVALKF